MSPHTHMESITECPWILKSMTQEPRVLIVIMKTFFKFSKKVFSDIFIYYCYLMNVSSMWFFFT